jgi:hypothetical protein
MNNYLRLLIFVIIYVLFVIRINFLNIQIDNYNLEYYSGKDNGVFKLFESIFLFSMVLFVVLAKSKRILFGVIGFISSFIATILAMMITSYHSLFPILTSIFLIVIFIVSEIILFRKKS